MNEQVGMNEPDKYEKIAEIGVIVTKPDGRRVPGCLAIGRPYLDGETAFCMVFLDGVDTPKSIGGADTLQAVCQAVRFLNSYLETLRMTGWKMTIAEENPPDADPDEEFPIEAYFGRVSNSENENAELKIQIKSLSDKIASVLEMAHKLRLHVTSASSYAKLLQGKDVTSDVFRDGLDRIQSHSMESVHLVQSLQGVGYEI
jgi:hypothetical protein